MRLRSMRQVARAAGIADEQHLDVTELALAEAGFAVAEIELPHPVERFRVAERASGVEAGEKSFTPARERRRVVRTDLFDVHDAQVARRRHRVHERALRRDAAARKDVALD